MVSVLLYVSNVIGDLNPCPSADELLTLHLFFFCYLDVLVLRRTQAVASGL